MKYSIAAVAALAATTGIASAGGLDRSSQSIDILFEDGNYAEFSYGRAAPDLTGSDLLGNVISNVGKDFGIVALALKVQATEKLSFAFISDEPYGSDVAFGGSPAATLLGGTSARADSRSLKALVRYKFTDNISLYGGPRYVQAKGSISLGGLAYGAPGVFLPGSANGYTAKFAEDNGWGYVVGGAFEIPKIALRVSVTYTSTIDLSLPTTESQNGVLLGVSAKTPAQMPEAIELKFQSGVAKDTLVFGGVRWSHWKNFTLVPTILPVNLAELDNSTVYTIGVGRRLTSALSASLSYIHEEGGPDSIVTPLAPIHGSDAISAGARYQLSEKVRISAGVRYTWFGDALPETGTPDTVRGSFKNNDAWSGGAKLGISF